MRACWNNLPGRSLYTTATASTALKAPGRSTGRASLRSSSLRSCGAYFVGAGSSGRPLSFPPCRLAGSAHPWRLAGSAHPCRLAGSAHPDTAHDSHKPPQPIARRAVRPGGRTRPVLIPRTITRDTDLRSGRGCARPPHRWKRADRRTPALNWGPPEQIIGTAQPRDPGVESSSVTRLAAEPAAEPAFSADMATVRQELCSVSRT